MWERWSLVDVDGLGPTLALHVDLSRPFLAGCRAALAGGRWALHLRGPSETMVDLGAHTGR